MKPEVWDPQPGEMHCLLSAVCTLQTYTLGKEKKTTTDQKPTDPPMTVSLRPKVWILTTCIQIKNNNKKKHNKIPGPVQK